MPTVKEHLVVMSREVNGQTQSVEIVPSAVENWEAHGYEKVKEFTRTATVAKSAPVEALAPAKVLDDGEEVDDAPSVRSIASLELPGKIEDALRAVGITTVSELAKSDDEALLAIDGIGAASVEKIRDALDEIED